MVCIGLDERQGRLVEGLGLWGREVAEDPPGGFTVQFKNQFHDLNVKVTIKAEFKRIRKN